MSCRDGTIVSPPGIVFLTVILLLTAFFAVPGAALAEGAQDDTGNVTIDADVADTDGDVRVLVELTDPPSVDGDESPEAYQNRIQAHAAESQADLVELVNQTDGMDLERQFWIVNAVAVTVNKTRADPSVLASVETVERIQADDQVSLHSASESVSGSDSAPRDELGLASNTSSERSGDTTDATWAVDRVGSPAVWDRLDNRGDGVTVAALDSGVNESHPDIDITDDNWKDFVNGNSEPYDDNGHGTPVSGSITGEDASGEYIGVAPDATLQHGKVLGEDGIGWRSDVIAGMEWAVEEDADVISMSLGSEGTASSYTDAVESANDAGVIVVASIGNDGEGTSGSPGNVYSSVGVGATNILDEVAEFSGGETIHTNEDWNNPPNHWPDEYIVPSVTAPGVFVPTASADGGIEDFHGTSAAAPHVSGVVALLLANADEPLSPEEVHDKLEETADVPDDAPDGKDTRYGAGIAHADEALLEHLDGDLQLTELNAPEDAPRGLPVTVTANVTNTGDGRETGTLSYAFGGEIVNETDVELDPDEEATVPLTHEIPADYPLGTITQSVNYDGDEETADLDVVRPAIFETTSVDTPQIVETGESFTVETTIENKGDIEGERDISVELGETLGDGSSTLYAAENVTLEPNETYVIDEQVATPSDQPIGWQQIGVDTGDSVSANETFVAETTGTIDGNVTDAETEEPRDEATVTAVRDDDGATFTTHVDSAGVFTEEIAVGEYNITTDADGFYPDTAENVTVTEDEAATETFELAPQPANVTAVVTDETVGNPVENATVELIAADPVSTGETNENGQVVLSIDRGEYDLVVSKKGYNDTEQNLTLTAGENVTEAVAVEPDDGSLNGTVVSTDRNESVPNATVTVTELDGESEWDTATDENGTYSLELPRNVDYSVAVDGEGYETTTASLDIGPGQSVIREYALDPMPATVSGTLTDPVSGWSIADADVTFDGNESRVVSSNETGEYVAGVPRGTYNLTVEHPAYRSTNDSIELARNESVDRSFDLNRTSTFYVLDDVNIPETIEEDDTVTVGTNVTNEGSDNETWELGMTLNGTTIATESLTVTPNETASLSISGDVDESPGNYSLQIETIAQAFSEGVEVESAPSSPSGGGGGGGGGGVGGGDDPELSVELFGFDDYTTIRVEDIPRSSEADIDTAHEVVGEPFTVSGLWMDFRFSPDDFRVEASDPRADAGGATPLPSEAGDAVGYFELDFIGADESTITETRVSLSVGGEMTGEGVSHDDLTIHQYTSDGWTPLETDLEDDTLTASLENINDEQLALAVDPPEGADSEESTEETDSEESTEETDSEESTEETDSEESSETPEESPEESYNISDGILFGLLGGIIAILGILLILRYRD